MWSTGMFMIGALMVRMYNNIVHNVIQLVGCCWLFIELNRLIKKLDKRAERADKQKKTPASARHALKKRVESTPSVTQAPSNAPLYLGHHQRATPTIHLQMKELIMMGRRHQAQHNLCCFLGDLLIY